MLAKWEGVGKVHDIFFSIPSHGGVMSLTHCLDVMLKNGAGALHFFIVLLSSNSQFK